MNRTRTIGSLYVIAIVLLLLLAVFHLSRTGSGAQPQPEGAAQAQATEQTGSGSGVFWELLEFGPDQSPGSWQAAPGEIVLRLGIAVLLSLILVFRPRKIVTGFVRGLHVAETQILLSVVSAALMLIVGDNAARAFAIFAAVALVRFRTNIRDPKEVTVLLICMALGLAAGVGRWDLGVFLCVFSLVLLWFLERAEPEMVLRPMELKLKTKDAEETRTVVEKVLEENEIESELLRLRQSEDSISQIIFLTQLRLEISTDEISEAIMERDDDLIESISWKRSKKSKTLYQH